MRNALSASVGSRQIMGDCQSCRGTGHERVRNDRIALIGATPASAPDVSSLGGQIVRTANRDKTSDCNLIEYHRRLGQEYPQSQNSKTTKAAKEAATSADPPYVRPGATNQLVNQKM